MASQQQPRRWFSLGSFSRPTQPPSLPPPPAPTPTPQQPITRPQVLQFRSPAPQPTLPQGTAPITPPRPAGAPTAASAPRSPVVPTPHSAPPPRSPVAPASAPPAVPAPRPPPAPSVTPAPLFPARPPPPTAPAPRSPAALPPPTTPTTRSPAASQPQTITKSNPTSLISKTAPTSMQTSLSKKASPAPSATFDMTSSSLPASPMRKVSATSISPSSPVTKPASPSRSPPPSAPSPTAVPTAIVANHARTAVSSPKSISTLSKTPLQSPQIKPIAHPPPPLTLSPAQTKTESDQEPKIPTEVEQQTVLVHEITPGKPKMMQKSSADFEQRYLETTNRHIGQNEEGKDVHKKPFDSEKFGMRIITLAGENKGAIMELNTSRNKGNSNGWRNGKELGAENPSGNEADRSNIKNRSHKSMEMQSQPMMALINSNVQGVNNSILYNGSFTQHDPGVHLSFSRKANVGRGIHLKDHIKMDAPKYAYPYPAQGYYQGPPVMAPPYAAPLPDRQPGFLEACLAALCCCCLLDACCDPFFLAF